MKLVTSTEFQNSAGRFLDEARKEPIGITKHKRASHVLLDIDEYERLKSHDPEAARKAKMAVLAEEDHERFGALYQELAK